jgi:hypothetical protein
MSPSRFTALLFTLLALAPVAHAARDPLPPDQIKLDQLVRDTQRSSSATKVLDLVWWIPPQFWSAALSQDTNTSPAVRNEITELFGKYTVVAAVRGDLGTFGVQKYATEAELRDVLQLVDAGGTRYLPLPDDKVDQRLNTLIQMLKPMFSSMLGQMGDNVNFYAFPARTPAGKLLADPMGDGNLVVRMSGEDYLFRLPLGSLLQPRRDAATGEVFPGSYQFNPYTGATLETAAAPH